MTVETGQEREGLVEIVGGLPEGSTVITSGQTRLAEGSPVVLRSATDPRRTTGHRGRRARSVTRE